MGLKTSDALLAALCSDCHRELDQGKDMSKAERRDMWNRACIRTYQTLVESGALVVKASGRMGELVAPFPYFGGKSRAAEQVREAFGEVENYVEPFAGSAAMLLAAPEGKRVETINDFDGFIANFWRAVAHDADSVAFHADWPTNENDLFARHSWLVRQRENMTDRLNADPDWYDAKIAGWWCWGHATGSAQAGVAAKGRGYTTASGSSKATPGRASTANSRI